MGLLFTAKAQYLKCMSQSDLFTSRRNFIKAAGLTGAASLIMASSVQAETGGKKASGKAKNIIYLVADGMGNGTLGLAHHWYLRKHGELMPYSQLLQHPAMHRSMQDTASASSPVTDSAAAASSWGCGQRVNNGSINVSTEGEHLKPILSYAKEAGMATGLVTTCRITHATPAGFAANVEKRGMEQEILLQYLDRKIDVLLGGGDKFFDAKLYTDFEAAGYAVAKNKDKLKAAGASDRLLGIFSRSHMPYAIDRANQPALGKVPGLVDMFAAGLKSLERSKNGFLLQVEAGRVDHAAHGNDAGAILHEMLEFNETVSFAIDYIEQHPDTLLIITTDHGTGGCQLNGQGSAYSDSGPALDRIEGISTSFEWLEDRFMADGKFDPDYFQQVTGVTASPDQIARVNDLIGKKVEYLSSAMTKLFDPELQALTAVGWTTNNHTSECVDLFAFGPGAAQVPAYVKNYEMFGIMRSSLGI